MPKILRIFNRLIVGGPVLNVAYLTKYLAPEFETLLIVGEKDEHEKSAEPWIRELGINYITIPEMGRSVKVANDFRAYKKIKKVIKDFQPDIVHTHAAKPGALGRWAAASLQVPVIVHTYHGHVFHSYFNSVKTNLFINVERYLARKTDAIIAISKQQQQELSQDFKIASLDKFRTVPLGFDLNAFQNHQAKKREQFRIEFGLTDDVIAIGIIGRLVPVKNHLLFLKSIAYVLQHSGKKIKAFIVGDGETRQDLENMANKLGLAFTTGMQVSHPHPIVFASWRSDIDVVNAGLDIITLTSFNEGTPVSLIEAQAANKPIVSTRVGGIQDIVIEGKTALLSDINNEEQFAKLLLQVVEDENLRRNLGTDSSAYVMQRFSYQRLVKDMSSLYNELLHKK